MVFDEEHGHELQGSNGWLCTIRYPLVSCGLVDAGTYRTPY